MSVKEILNLIKEQNDKSARIYKYISNYFKVIAGVPDSAIKGFCDYVDNQSVVEHVKAANEGLALSYASGYYLSKNQPAFIYLQNSGLGNLINPLTSLTDKQVCDSSSNFYWLERFKGEKDEPQHKKMEQFQIKF